MVTEGHVPPTVVSQQAEKGLKLRAKFSRGGTLVGVARARDLKNRKPISYDTIKRMASFFARHGVDKRAKNWGDDDNPSAGYVAWLLWGGEPGRDWADMIKRRLDEADDRPANHGNSKRRST